MAEQDPDILNTGLQNLNGVLKENGFVPGSTITVVADPASVGDLLVYNFTGGRDTYYLTTARREDDVKDSIHGAGDYREDIHYYGLDEEPVVEEAIEVVQNLSVTEPSTFVVDPVNPLEMSDGPKYRKFLSELNDLIVESGSLGVLLCLQEAESPSVPENRWRTKHMSDSVFQVMHEVTTQSVNDFLTLEKLSPEQNLVDEDLRVFQLPRELDMDIETKKNMSP